MAASTGLLNYTTKVPSSRTINEMQDALGRAGARRVMVEYANGAPAALAFSLPTAHGERLYTLPCDIDAVLRVLKDTDPTLLRTNKIKADREQAEKVAWRVLKDWLEAQLALVRTQMAPLDQVMLPYLHVAPELTLYEAWAQDEGRALPAGSS